MIKRDQGLSVMLAAGDTFRAAAVEQLQAWGERNDVAVIAQQSGADPAAVIYDAMEAAVAGGYDVVYVDNEGAAERRVVETGFTDSDHTQILSGVVAGERVVVKGQRSLKHGSPIKVLEGAGESPVADTDTTLQKRRPQGRRGS